jgi:hypothetical protein
MYVGILRTAGLAKEPAVGTLTVPPTTFVPYIPPDGFSTAITLLESAGIRALPDKTVKATQGPAAITGAKIKTELEPENTGPIFMGAFGVDTKTGSAPSGYTHTFTRLANAQLPTYTWWFDRGANYPQFTGCMVNKLDVELKAKEFVTIESEWVALGYDGSGITHSPTYSPAKSFVFNEAVVLVDTVNIKNYDNLKISIDNMVKADHAISGSIYPAKIYSEGFQVTLSGDLFFEDTTQYAKFLAGTYASFNITLTSSEDITGATPGTKYSLAFDMPNLKYMTFPLINPVGVLKISFTARLIFDTGTSKTMSVALTNSASAAY